MNEENKKTGKSFLLMGIGIIAIVAIIVCFAIAIRNTKTSSLNTNEAKNSGETISSNTETASEISLEYNSISYGDSTEVDNSKNITITNGGSFNLSGSYETITINTTKDVELNLNNAEITNQNGPAINVENANTVKIVLTGTNKITSNTTEDLDGAIYSKDDLIFSGTGSLEIKSNYDGIVSKDTLVINSGTYIINASDDGVHSNGNITINNGEFTITSKDDGIHSDGLIEINNGTFNITAAEGIEATYVKINGGTIDITGNSPFDYDGESKYTGGTIIVNGTETNTITNQMMGGGMNGGGRGMKQMQIPQDQDQNQMQMPQGEMPQNRGEMRQNQKQDKIQNKENMKQDKSGI